MAPLCSQLARLVSGDLTSAQATHGIDQAKAGIHSPCRCSSAVGPVAVTQAFNPIRPAGCCMPNGDAGLPPSPSVPTQPGPAGALCRPTPWRLCAAMLCSGCCFVVLLDLHASPTSDACKLLRHADIMPPAQPLGMLTDGTRGYSGGPCWYTPTGQTRALLQYYCTWCWSNVDQRTAIHVPTTDLIPSPRPLPA